MFVEKVTDAKIVLSVVETEKFVDYLCRNNVRYNIHCFDHGTLGEMLAKRIVSFSGTDEQIEKINRWLKMLENGIQPCPFCGGAAEIKKVTDCDMWGIIRRTVFIECLDCGAHRRTHVYDGLIDITEVEEAAKADWNQRV